jgi:hypothetical protein
MAGPFDGTGVSFDGAVPVPFKPAMIKGPPPPPGSAVVSISGDDDHAEEEEESEESESEESESEREENEELPCFCNSRTAPTAADFAFAGVYVQCERCSRWCHGVCANLTRKDAAQLERITREVGLADAIGLGAEILAGQVRGRVVVDVNR